MVWGRTLKNGWMEFGRGRFPTGGCLSYQGGRNDRYLTVHVSGSQTASEASNVVVGMYSGSHRRGSVAAWQRGSVAAWQRGSVAAASKEVRPQNHPTVCAAIHVWPPGRAILNVIPCPASPPKPVDLSVSFDSRTQAGRTGHSAPCKTSPTLDSSRGRWARRAGYRCRLVAGWQGASRLARLQGPP